MERQKLKAEKRTITGRKVKKLRREGILPGNVFGNKVKSLSLQVPTKEFQKLYSQVGESGLIDLAVDGEVKPVLVHNVHFHPVSSDPLHVDFHQVSLTEKTTAMIQIELIGESPAVESKIGILIQPLSEVEVEALPTDLPDHLEANVSTLTEIGQAITVADLKFDKAKVEIKADPEEVVAKIDALAEEVELPPVPA
ncbi:MAG: 50S ribosomal protein L25, partial [bacterium]|nr:50S ribosomal protein L25 [bacterium]